MDCDLNTDVMEYVNYLPPGPGHSDRKPCFSRRVQDVHVGNLSLNHLKDEILGSELVHA